MSVQEELALRKLVRFIIMFVARTHFDLAWWMSRRLFVDFRFEPVMSILIETLEEDDGLKFTVDGQVYLVLRWIINSVSPREIASRMRRVTALVRSGRLQVGPSYILPDEFLAPGEAQIRNLLLGRKVSMELGAPKLQVVDHSDVFGHPAQIPQIMSPFTGTFMFTRGLTEAQIQHAAFRWPAPNGDSVIGIAHPGGYGNGYEFARKSQEVSLQTVANFLDNYLPRYLDCDVLLGLLCGGGDHTALAPRIHEDLAAARAAFPEVGFVIGTDNDYAAHLNLDASKLPVVKGELYASGRQNILRHVDSARQYLKQRNAEVFTVLQNAETLTSLAYLRTHQWVRHLVSSLERCWSDFLVLQSHDAVTGCHVDDVSDDMLVTYNNIEQELNMVMQTAMAELSGQPFVMSHRQRYGLVPTPEFGLWNPLPYERSEVVIVNLPPQLQGRSQLLAKVNGRAAEVQRLDSTRAALPVEAGSFGSTAVELAASARADVPKGSKLQGVRNEHLIVQVRPNGTFDITDAQNGRTLTGLGRLTSEGDRGDEYNRDLIGDRVDSSGVNATSRITVSGPLVQELEIKFDFVVPERLDAPRIGRIGQVTIPVTTTLRLRRGSRMLEANTSIDNAASDQLLRVEFPFVEKLAESRALSVFIVQPHPVPPPYDPNWMAGTTDKEPPFTTFSNQGMVMAGPLVSFNRGLTEYEVYDTPAGKSVLALTLQRGVGFLSRDDIRTRRPDPTSGTAGAGPQLAVPGAQCLGQRKFDYTVGFVGEASDIQWAQRAQRWQHSFVTVPYTFDSKGILTGQLGQSVFSGLKPAEDGQGVILRAWAGAETALLQLQGEFAATQRVNLAEEPSELRNLRIVRRYEIASVRLEP